MNPTVWMVAPAPEEEVIVEEMMPQPSEDNSGESYEAQPDDMPVSTGDIEIAVRVAHTLRHSWEGVSDATRSDIVSVMRSVKCTTLTF